MAAAAAGPGGDVRRRRKVWERRACRCRRGDTAAVPGCVRRGSQRGLLECAEAAAGPGRPRSPGQIRQRAWHEEKVMISVDAHARRGTIIS